MQLRDYQENAVEEALGAVTFGSKNVIIKVPTGGGKSLIISELAERLDGIVVIVVNISPLLDQIAEHLNELGSDFSILKAGRESEFDPNHKIQLVMSQTYYARKDYVDMYADYIVIDERHREYKTDRTNALINNLKPKAIIGTTATPFDKSGFALSDSEIIESNTVESMTKDGFLSPIKYYVPNWATKLELESLGRSGADYSGSDIDKMVIDKNHTDMVIQSMNQMNAKDKKTLVFCNSIEHCELVVSELKKDGYYAESIHSKKDSKENEDILARFKGIKLASTDSLIEIESKPVKCLVSVSKLNIGFDVKDVQLGVMLRPTKVLSLYLQTVGRMTRTYKQLDDLLEKYPNNS